MNVVIKNIRIGGFANIDDVTIYDNMSSVFVAPNNYGKSNVLAAVNFGVKFMHATDDDRLYMMSDTSVKPINSVIEDRNFRFEIEYSTLFEGIECLVSYKYEFLWTSQNNAGSIFSEVLKLKQDGDPKYKYKTLISRKGSDVFEYVPSPSGRCNKFHVAHNNILAINLLSNNYDLFFSSLLREITSISIPYLDTLENPNIYFSTDERAGILLLDGKTISAYMYDLKINKQENYSLLKSGILQLLPGIENFEPSETVLGDGISNKVYDIRIKERQNSQATSIRQLSSGSKRVIFILTMCVMADIKGIPMMLLEEPENSIHPKLLQNLLSCMRGLAESTKIVLTSHSTHIMRYFDPERLYLGLPNKDGLAKFARLKPGKVKAIYRKASDMDITFGEYMYEMLLDMEDDSELTNEYFQL